MGTLAPLTVDPALLEALGGDLTTVISEHMPFLVNDMGGVIRYVNGKFCDLLGYTADELVGMDSRVLLVAHHTEQALRELWTTLTAGRVWKGELIHRAKDGTPRWLETTIVPLRNAEGRTQHAFALHTDVTPVKQLVQSLAAREQQYNDRVQRERNYAEAVLSSLPGIFYHFDTQGRMLRWNRNFELVTGYSTDEIAQMTNADFFPEDAKAKVATAVREVFERGQSMVEADLLSKRGARLHHLMTGVRFDYGGQMHLVGIGTDLTAHKRTEDALRDSLARFDAAARATGDVLWDWNLTNDALWWNDNYATHFGYQPVEIEPTIVSWTSRIHPDDQMRVETHIRQVIDGTEDTWSDEYRFRRKDGTYADVFDRGYVLRNVTGTAVRMVGAIMDITERKEAQRQLVAFNVELEQRVADRTRDLEALNRELESFCYSVSHDLRAPLRGISGFAEIVVRDHKAQLDPEGARLLDRVVAATRRMGELIDDLLRLSRVSRDAMHRQRVDLSAMAHEVIATLRHVEPTREVEVVIEDGLVADGDARLLRVVLENLLGNAWKFTSKTPQPRVTFTRTTFDDGSPAFAVTDNGAGFDMRYADKLFGAFQRLHGMAEFPGTGIGLATVQRIINRHGGHIAATAELGKGACFRFTFESPLP